MLKICYVGQLWHGGTCLARARALERLGFDVQQFDVTPYQQRGARLMRALTHRLLVGSAIDFLNRDLRALVVGGGLFDILWVDKGTWIYPQTLEAARRAGVSLLVHYTPDPAFHVHHSRHFRACVPLYDLCVTTKRYELEHYRRAGAREILFTWQGVDERFSRLAECGRIETSGRRGLLFVGHHESYYERVLSAVAETGLPLRVMGPRWPRKVSAKTKLGAAVQGDGVVGDAYAACLATAQIGLGLLSKLCPDGFTTRTFEIPAAGAMLLAEDTPEHRELFRAGEEADFFSCIEELIDKARYYLTRDSLRHRIARNGRERVLRDFTWERALEPIRRMLTGRREPVV